MAINHRQARTDLMAGWAKARPGEAPSLAALQVVQAIGAHEGGYGTTWAGDMVGSFNWGAITCGGGHSDGAGGYVCPAGCAPNVDSKPTAGGQVKYTTCFRRYASSADGAAGLVAFLAARPRIWTVIGSGDLDAITWAMRQEKYFLGFNANPRTSATQYANALAPQLQAIATANGEPLQVHRGPQDLTTGAQPAGLSTGEVVGWIGAAGLAIVVGRQLWKAV